MSSTPVISVIIPAYNHEQYIAQAIESVLAQDVDALELIVIDDCSSDRTAQIVEGFSDSRLRLVCHGWNLGSAETINEGIRLARGEYVSILNSDDWYAAGRLRRLLELANETGASFLFSDVQVVDGTGLLIDDPHHYWVHWFTLLKQCWRARKNYAEGFLKGNFAISTSNFFIRRQVFDEIGLIHDYRFVPDYDFIFRFLCLHPDKIHFADGEALLYYRLHGGNTILDSVYESNRETAELLVRYFPKLCPEAQQHLMTAFRWQMRKTGMHAHTAVKEALSDENAYAEKVLREHRNVVNAPPLSVWGYACQRFRRLVRSVFPSLSDAARRRVKTSSVDELRRRLLAIRPSVDLYSFDVFDTLLARRIAPPEAVHEAMARLLMEKLGGRFSATYLLELRRREEAVLRQESQQAGRDYECRYDDLVVRWVRAIHRKEEHALCAWIRETELSLEMDALYAKEGVRDMLLALRGTGARVIAVSDMYFSRRQIEQLLLAKGLRDCLDAIHVSCEYGVCKGTGRLFETVLAREDVLPGRVAHSGDNLISDYDVPAQYGMHAFLLAEKNELRRYHLLGRYAALAQKDLYWKGRHLVQVAFGGAAPNAERMQEPYYRLGFSILGPIFSVFAQGMMEALLERGIRHVSFLARDGYLPQTLFQLFREERLALWGAGDPAAEIRDEYVCLSRHSAAAAVGIHGLPKELAVLALFNPKQKGLSSILKSYGLPVAEFTEFAKRHNLPMDEKLEDFDDPRLVSFLEDDEVQEAIRQQSRPAWSLLQRYMEQRGFFGSSRAALVDIGWNGTVQRFLRTAFGERDDYPETHGLYLAFCTGMGHQFDNCDHAQGLICDDRLRLATDRIVMQFEELFEEAARAAHATTIGYREVDAGVVEPVYKSDTSPDRKVELEGNDHIAQLQDGILAFAKRFLAAQRLTGYTCAELRPFILTLAERVVAYPTKEEVGLLGQLVHTEDWGHDNLLDMQEEEKSLSFWRYPRRAIAMSLWKHGLVRQKLGGLGTFPFRLLQIRRHK